MMWFAIFACFWLLLSGVMFIFDWREGHFEEETVVGNLTYYLIQVPVILILEGIFEIINYFRRKLR